MSLAKFRKVFKGHKNPSPPKTKVSPENTPQPSNDQTPQTPTPFVEVWKIIS